MRYVVQPGDTLFIIADRFDVSYSALLAANPQISDADVIFTGQIIVIPGERRPTPRPTHRPTPRPTQRPTPRPTPGPRQRYVVQTGDTLFFIARRFGVSLGELIAANPQISDPNVLFPGQIIFIP